jgi:arginyl-tRNA synthetase
VLGDCLSRLLEFQGHDVHRINHVGDWGTQFGMLIEYMLDNPVTSTVANTSIGDVDVSVEGGNEQYTMANLADIYRKARERFSSDESFQQRSRERVVILQEGSDLQTKEMWSSICTSSREEFGEIYDMLGVDKRLTERGESSYNYLLESTVVRLMEQGVAKESAGAICIFPDTPDGRGEREEQCSCGCVYIISDRVSCYSYLTLRYYCDVQINRMINLIT